MSRADCKRSRQPSPPSLQQIQDQIHATCDDIMHFCMQPTEIPYLSRREIVTVSHLFMSLFVLSALSHVGSPPI